MVKFIRISEGITHLDDLPLSKFIEMLGRLKSMSFTEKLDGSALQVGVDEAGKLYTSREGKRAKAERMYTPDQWTAVGGNNAFKAAHTALLKVEDKLKKTIGKGQAVELEVLFGSQPNTVDYGDEGKNMLAVLRAADGTPSEVAQAVSDALKGTDIDVNVTLLASDDGERIKDSPTVLTFKFTTPKKLDAAKLEDSKFHEEVNKLTAFLKEKSSVGMSNLELAEINLQKVDKEKRAEIKTAREELLNTLETEYKAPLKRLMLDLLLGNDKKKAEGVVGTDENGEQIKIIDKDGFSAANKQNQYERQSLMGPVMTIDPGASIESRGGVVGELKIKLADLLGNVDLARGAELKKVLRTMKGKTTVDTLKSFASQFKPDDFQQIKTKAEALVDATLKHVAERLEKFKAATKTDITGQGKIGPDVVKRTLLFYAEVRKNLKILREKIGSSNDIQHFVNALYGGAIASIHQEDPKVNEELLEHKGELDKSEYKKDAYTLLNCYLANTFMTMLVIHEQDKLGLKRIRDKKNYLMKHWSIDMSPMNFWGYAIWRHTRKDVKDLLSPQAEKELKHMTKHVQPSWFKYMHMDFSFDGSVTIDWADHHRTLKRLIDSSGYRTPRVNTLLKGMFDWPTLDFDERVKVLNQLYMQCMQFVPTSYLFKRMKAIQSKMLMNANGENYQMVAEGSLLKSFTSLAEDGETSSAAVGGAFPTVGQPVVATATNSADIAPVEKRLGDKESRMIIRRKRNPDVALKTRKFKDPRKNHGTLKDPS